MREDIDHLGIQGDLPQEASHSEGAIADESHSAQFDLPNGASADDGEDTILPTSSADEGFGVQGDADEEGAETADFPDQPIEEREAAPELEEYDHTFDEAVNPVVQRYQDHLQSHTEHGTSPEDTFDQLPGYIGHGADKVVFRAELPNGSPVAVKLLRRDVGMGLGRSHELNDDEIAQETRAHTVPLRKAAGKPKLEQLLTADPERGVLVTSFFEGKMTSKMQWRDFRAVSEQDLSELQTTIATMRELGLVPENKGSIIFRRGEGFSVVDYMDANREDDVFRPSTVRFDTLEGFIEDITVDSKWENGRNAARWAGAPRDPYYDRPVIHGMARGRLLKMARKIQ